jgi:hypothetical protein
MKRKRTKCGVLRATNPGSIGSGGQQIIIQGNLWHRLRKMKMEKKRVSAKPRMMHAALDSEFLYEALFSE